MRILALGVLIALAGVSLQPAPNTEVYLTDLGPVASPKFDGTLVNISNSPGYDNQPSFTPDGKAILFSSVRGDTQYDIYRYDIASKALTNLTRSPENENSPLVTPDGRTFSAVRTEMDKTQRLWRFNLDGSNPQIILENVKPVGYHVWIDATHVALFVLGGRGEPNTLQIADTTTGTAEVVAKNPGRAIAMRPEFQPQRIGPTLTYVNKEQTPWAIWGLDVRTHEMQLVAPLSRGADGAGVEDYAWDPSVAGGRAVFAWGTRLMYRWPLSRGAAGFGMLGDVGAAGVVRVSRLAVNVSGGHLRIAFVAEPVAK